MEGTGVKLSLKSNLQELLHEGDILTDFWAVFIILIFFWQNVLRTVNVSL